MRKALAVIAVLLLFGCGWLMFAITGCDPSVPAENGAERAQTGPADSARSSDGARLRSIASLQADVARLLDQELAEQSSDYRAAVEEIFYRQVVFCDGTDRPDRVTVSWAPGKQGELRLSLHSPGRHNYGDNHPDAITLYGGAVVGLTFSIESNIDACPCGGPEFPDYLDDEFLKTIARIDTLESIDLSCSGVTDAGLKTLAQLKNLRSVNLERTTLTCDGLKHLGTLHHLETFAYSPGDRSGRIEWIPAQVCEIAAGHRHLRDLRLEWVEFDKKAARALAACAELESLKVTGTLLEADALLAFEGNASLESMHLYFTCRAIGPIRLGGLSRVSRLGVTVEAPNVDIALADLPTVRDLGLFVRHGAPEEAHTAESVGSDRKAAPGPRVSVRRLADLRQASFGVRDRRFESTTEHGVVQLGELPSLANLAFHGLDGKLEVEGTCVNLKRLTASEAAIPASLYQALPRFPQLEELTLYGPREPDRHLPVTLEEISPVFNLPHLRTLRIACVRGGLTFEPFLKLPGLKELRLERCQMADPFEAVGHAELESLFLEWSAPQHVTFHDMPKLRRFTVAKSAEFTSARLTDCPSLEWCWCESTPSLTKLDLRETKIRAPKKFRTMLGDRDDALVMPETGDVQ